MTFQVKDRWNIPVTAVADEFIDLYMAAANGEYVKVYLYLLRHQSEPVSVDAIADALNHTESDVRRALAYWEKAGVLLREDLLLPDSREKDAGSAEDRPKAGAVLEREMSGGRGAAFSADPQVSPDSRSTAYHGSTQAGADGWSASYSGAPQAVNQTAPCCRPAPGCGFGACAGSRTDGQRFLWCSPRGGRSKPQAGLLRGPGEPPVRRRGVCQILYIAQKYMNKVFTPRDCQVFAYLYDTLKFSPELLEYLVEYCVQNGHVSVRYMETVAINWHEQGFRTPDEAKEYAEGFNNDAFSVMKAFGLNDRRPATEEQKMITKWFREYGFGRELVLMACNRTISAIHTPSFRYTDKILSDWKQAGVRTKADVEALDEKRSKSRAQGTGGQAQGGRSSGGQGAGQADGGRRKSNQFHNFKQRDTDYDALVLKQLKERVNQQ